MQMTIDKYKDDPNVVFLFVNTLERVSETEKIKLIDKLFDKNKYSFRVVLDERLGGGKNYKTASQYQVNAIPTKVVINPKGQVVFNETSSLINIDLIAEELTMMIELAKNVRQ
jgi:ABC-type histidine transport system ATPase subunit